MPKNHTSLNAKKLGDIYKLLERPKQQTLDTNLNTMIIEKTVKVLKIGQSAGKKLCYKHS